jgi:hypothetical protein
LRLVVSNSLDPNLRPSTTVAQCLRYSLDDDDDWIDDVVHVPAAVTNDYYYVLVTMVKQDDCNGCLDEKATDPK